MTFNIGHVEGGTNAGCKRPLKPAPARWFCNCEGPDGMRLNPGYLVTCPDCKARHFPERG